MPAPRRPALPIVAALIAAASPVASADRDSAFTVYGALRDGGSFVDSASDRKLRVDGSGAAAASIDLGIDGARQLQVYVSHQSSHLRLDAATPAPSPPPARLPLSVTYLHLGGTNFFDGPIGRGPYVAGGLGATLLRPGSDGYSNEVRPSLNVGIGYQLPLGDRIAMRFEARGYFTLIDSSGGLFCSGGCVVVIKGDGFTQGEAQVGLSLRF